MGAVRFTSEVAAPVAEVFAAHVEAESIPEWFPGVQAIEDVSGPLDQVGTTYRLRFGPLLESRCEVVASDPPRMHARTWNARPFGTAGKATMRFFEERPGRTRIDFQATFDLPLGPLGKLVGRLPAVRRRADRDMRREIDAFEEFVERRGDEP